MWHKMKPVRTNRCEHCQYFRFLQVRTSCTSWASGWTRARRRARRCRRRSACRRPDAACCRAAPLTVCSASPTATTATQPSVPTNILTELSLFARTQSANFVCFCAAVCDLGARSKITSTRDNEGPQLLYLQSCRFVVPSVVRSRLLNLASCAQMPKSDNVQRKDLLNHLICTVWFSCQREKCVISAVHCTHSVKSIPLFHISGNFSHVQKTDTHSGYSSSCSKVAQAQLEQSHKFSQTCTYTGKQLTAARTQNESVELNTIGRQQ